MDLWAVVPELVIAAMTLVLVPLAGLVRGRWQVLPAVAAGAAVLVSFVASMYLLGAGLPGSAFCGTYAADGFGTLFKLMIECTSLVALVMVGTYFRGHPNEGHAPVLILFATVGALGMVSSLDLGLLMLFLQILSIASYLLVALVRTNAGAQEATLKYFVYGAATLAIMGYGLSFLYGLTGSLEFANIGRNMSHAESTWVVVTIGLIFVGYAFKITAVPFHFWAPDVYSGATAPVAGFISVLPKLAAFAALLRFVQQALPQHEYLWAPSLAVIAVATMSVGNVGALTQTKLKRLLAYSSIAQAGYMLMGTALALRAPGAAGAVVFYLASYALMNLGAFAVVAIVERMNGDDANSLLTGLASRSPWLALCMTVSLLSLAGFPPLAGFAGKVFLLTAAIDGKMMWLAITAGVNMVVGLYIYAKLIATMFFEKPGDMPPLRVANGFKSVAIFTTLGTIILGLFPDLLLSLINSLRL